jgi:transposase
MCSICYITTLCLNNRVAKPLHAADKPPEEDLLQFGKLKRAVAAHFNVSQIVILRLWNRFQHTGFVAKRPHSGRPRSTTARQDRYLVNMAKWQRFQSADRLNTDFQTATRVRVTPQTYRNRLHAANLRAFRPAVRPKLTLRHRTATLQWARNHAN